MLFTDGKHQTFERMMRQTPRNPTRSSSEKKRPKPKPSTPQENPTSPKERPAHGNQ